MKIKKFKFKSDDKPTPVKFNSIGDSFTGEYRYFGENKRFKDVWYIIMEKEGTSYIISCPTDLKNKFKLLVKTNKIGSGDKLKIEYVEDRKTKYTNNKKIFDISKVIE